MVSRQRRLPAWLLRWSSAHRVSTVVEGPARRLHRTLLDPQQRGHSSAAAFEDHRGGTHYLHGVGEIVEPERIDLTSTAGRILSFVLSTRR